MAAMLASMVAMLASVVAMLPLTYTAGGSHLATLATTLIPTNAQPQRPQSPGRFHLSLCSQRQPSSVPVRHGSHLALYSYNHR